MNDKIKIYELLLDEKASLEKECIYLSMEYAREFGVDIETLFSLKVDAITLKKKLAFCVRKHNKGETIFSNELDKYIDEEILEYQNRLEELIQYNLLARCGEKTYISHNEFKNIKKLYYEIAHLIHPDLHPEYKDDEEILELWNNAVDAYKNNEYKHLVEIYDSIIIKVKSSDIYIENIDIKIDTIKEEIQNIKENDPYKYKFILDDEDEIKALHESFEKEIKDYNEYISSLEKELSNFVVVERHED